MAAGSAKKDPAQFLQVHGRACKVHLDSAVALAAESPVNMMPWQGDTNNMIDRFDVRAHLDYIPMYTPPLLNPISPEQESDERKCNYERYRGLVQNDFAGISEEQCLYQIYIDELYGGLQKPNEDEKKKLAEKKASIGYTYEDSTVAELENSLEKRGDEEDSEEDSNTDEDEVIPDIDVEVDVDELNQEQVADLNKQATTYGMAEGDFVRMLRKDKEEAEAIKHAKALEEEKAMYSGRRSRRQRREFREKRLKGRKISPPSYARRDSPTYDPYKRSPSESTSESRSRSRSPSPGHEEKITFITSTLAGDAADTRGRAAGTSRRENVPGGSGWLVAAGRGSRAEPPGADRERFEQVAAGKRLCPRFSEPRGGRTGLPAALLLGQGRGRSGCGVRVKLVGSRRGTLRHLWHLQGGGFGRQKSKCESNLLLHLRKGSIWAAPWEVGEGIGWWLSRAVSQHSAACCPQEELSCTRLGGFGAVPAAPGRRSGRDADAGQGRRLLSPCSTAPGCARARGCRRDPAAPPPLSLRASRTPGLRVAPLHVAEPLALCVPSRRRSSSSSTSPSSSSSSSSRSSSRSHRGGGYHRSSRYCRSHSRRYSRSRSRSRRYSGGGSRDSRRRSRSYSPDRGYRYSSRRRSRSRSRSGERYRRSGRSSRHWSSSPSSRSPSDSRSRSKSMSPVREKPLRPAASPAVGEKLKKADTAAGKETGAAKPKLTPQEKLKLRMQKALNRQFKADKKAAQEKMLQQEHERQEREDELRAMARKIRMKERERREKEREEWERQYSRQSRSPSPRYSREYSSSRRRSRSRSRSPHYRH
nr:PREDICTED: CLK4-associating serine/arginine rich protein [Apteryx mantelli mantelli]